MRLLDHQVAQFFYSHKQTLVLLKANNPNMVVGTTSWQLDFSPLVFHLGTKVPKSFLNDQGCNKLLPPAMTHTLCTIECCSVKNLQTRECYINTLGVHKLAQVTFVLLHWFPNTAQHPQDKWKRQFTTLAVIKGMHCWYSSLSRPLLWNVLV